MLSYKEILEKAEKYIPLMARSPYPERLKTALEKRKLTVQKYLNPFEKLVGEYPIKLTADTATLEKVQMIQTEIRDWLREQYPDREYVFSPLDTRHVKVLEDGRVRIVRLARELRGAPLRIMNLLARFPSVRPLEGKIVITTDPVDILRKSSSRKWEEESCERLGGDYDKGPFSDIANRNAIAYFYRKGAIEPSGRYMLRWCINDEGVEDVGVEPVMYPRTHKHRLEIYKKITEIIRAKGFGTYETCETPYWYEGYSDFKGGPGKIKYGPPEDVTLIHYATDPKISYPMASWLLDAETNVRRALAENKKVCEYDRVVERMLNDLDGQVIKNVLHTCTPLIDCKTADRLASHKDESVRRELAKNRNIPEDCACKIYDRLSQDEYWGVREAVAANPSIPRECACKILDRLSQDEEWDVRWGVAVNKNIPEDCACEIFDRLSKDEKWSVRREVAENRNIPEDCACKILERLSKEDYWKVRMAVAENTNIPSECACNIFDKLSRDEEQVVRLEVSRNETIPEDCACEIFDRLSRDEGRFVRRRVSLNETIPSKCACKILERLSKDERKEVRLGVAVNPSIPEECVCDILDRLSRDDEKDVRKGVALNRTIPKECACDILKRLSKDDEEGVRWKVAENTSIPKECACEILDRLSEDKWFVRWGVVKNPNIPEECVCNIFKKLKDEFSVEAEKNPAFDICR